MQDLFNFTNADGEVIMLFDGKITLSQFLMIIAAIAVVLFAIKVLKAAARVVVCVIAVCVCLVHFQIASPDQIKDAATQIAQAGMAGYQTVINSSQNIRWEEGTLQVNIADNWVKVSDIDSIVGGDENMATVVIGGETYVVEDTAIIKLLKTFT